MAETYLESNIVLLSSLDGHTNCVVHSEFMTSVVHSGLVGKGGSGCYITTRCCEISVNMCAEGVDVRHRELLIAEVTHVI